MAVDRIKKRMSRLEAAAQLERLLQELKDGRVSVGRRIQRLPASDQVDVWRSLTMTAFASNSDGRSEQP